MGSILEWKNFCSGRVRNVLRRDPAEILLLLRQPEPALHAASLSGEADLPESARELRSQSCSLSTPDHQLRCAESLCGGVQTEQPKRGGGGLGGERGLLGVAGFAFVPHWRCKPGAVHGGQRDQGLSNAARAHEPELREYYAANHGCTVVLQRAA